MCTMQITMPRISRREVFFNPPGMCSLTHSIVEVYPHVLIISIPYKPTRVDDKKQVELRERPGYLKISENTFIKHILYLRIFITWSYCPLK